jgi:hypothetical protein
VTINRRALANELADNVRELARRAPEFWANAQEVMRDLCIEPQALADDLGCTVNELDARLAVEAVTEH